MPADVFDEATVRGLAERFLRMLTAVCADPGVAVGDVDILDTRSGGGCCRCGRRRRNRGRSLAEILAEAVGVARDAVAVVCAGRGVVWGVGRVVGSVGAGIDRRGAGPERFVRGGVRRGRWSRCWRCGR